MKNGFVYLLIASLMFSYNSIGGYENYQEKDNIEYLLNQRINIMNEFLYGSKEANDIEYLNSKLNEIEAGELLENDLDILYKVIDNPTDYELALSVKVDDLKSLEELDNAIHINADLDWSISGYDGNFNMVKNYDIKCIEKNGKIYLSKLKYNE